LLKERRQGEQERGRQTQRRDADHVVIAIQFDRAEYVQVNVGKM
jgi:hypothetical protein